MKIAISTDGKNVSAHFGRCPNFTIIDIENGKVIKREVLPNPGHEPGAIPRFLHEKGAKVIIAGGMGPRAAGFFDELKIKAIMGIDGSIEDVIEALAKGTLKDDGGSTCLPGAGRGYGVEKSECEHPEEKGE